MARVRNNFISFITFYVVATLSYESSFALFRIRQKASPIFKLERRDAGLSWSPKIAKSGGDVVIGVLLPVHSSQNEGEPCSKLYIDGLVLVEAIVFAFREVRRRKLLPENITLGYDIRDTCNSFIVSKRHTLDLVLEVLKQQRTGGFTGNTKRNNLLNVSSMNTVTGGKVIAVVGAGNSELSIPVNRVLSAFNIPQIGFASTSRFLSDKQRFPSFFRVVSPDSFQVKALVALFQKFKWNYVGLLVSDGDYGRPMGQSFKSMAKDRGICIGFERLVPFGIRNTMANKIVKELTLKQKLEIIVILLPESDVKTILEAMLKSGFSNKTLIASDSWSMSTENYSNKRFSTILKGTLGTANHYVRNKEFEEYFLALTPHTNTWNPWFNETWEHLFDCRVPNLPSHINEAVGKSHRSKKRSCNLWKQQLNRGQFSGFHRVLNIINAVFAITHGLRQSCLMNNGTSSNRQNSSCLSSLNPRKLLDNLKGLKFRGYHGRDVSFDQNGDVEGKYDLVNIFPNLTIENIGSWEGGKKRTFHVNVSKIVWSSGRHSPPKGVCAQPCPPGLYQRPLKNDPNCCWKCHRCHEGSISNKSGATGCVECGNHLMSNLNRTACIFIPVNYLNWQNSWTISIVAIASISLLLLIFIVILFVRYANTPVVKSSNRELSFLLCLGLFVTFIVPFVFAGKPTATKCTVSQTMFCVGSALALSAMLAKTLRIVLVFELQNRDRYKWFLKNKHEFALTLVLTFAELTYCLLWVAINPPNVKIIQLTYTTRYMICKFDKRWYGGSHVLLIMLSLVCTGLAVRGRKLPKNFNEAKHITLSMFTFNIIWVVFMGAQYGASIQYNAQINCFAIIISSLTILVVLFGPKAFFMLFRPQLNTKEEFQEEAREYAFKHSNINIFNGDGTESSRSVSTVTSLKRGSISNSSYLVNYGPRKAQFLSVPFDVSIHSRNRAHSLHALSSTAPMNKVHHTSCGNGQIMGPRNDPWEVHGLDTSTSREQVIKQGRRSFGKKYLGGTDNQFVFRLHCCEFCHQTIKESFYRSLPNILMAPNEGSEMVVYNDIYKQGTNTPHLHSDPQKFIALRRLWHIPNQSTKFGEEQSKSRNHGIRELSSSDDLNQAHDNCKRLNKECLKSKNSLHSSNERSETFFSTSFLPLEGAFQPFSRHLNNIDNRWDYCDWETTKLKFNDECARETIL